MLVRDLRRTIKISYENVPVWIREIPDHLITQEICNEAVRIEPYLFAVVPHRFKTHEMCNDAVLREAFTLYYVPEDLKNQEIYNEAVRIDLRSL